jgi:glutamine synthetase
MPLGSSSEVNSPARTSSFVAYKRNEIERFERYVTDWEYREYAYHL